jgi:gliding motility-associated-like protein
VSRYLVFIIVLLPLALQAQITAPESRTVRMTDYPVTSREDPVFIFCVNDAGEKGSLTAASPGGTAPYTFTWTMYDRTGGSYSIPVKTETGVTSTAGGLSEGGYRVSISDGGGYSTELYAWVNIDKPVANATLLAYTCDYVALDGTAAPDNFDYYDPATGASKRLPNGVKYHWSSTPESLIPFPDLRIDPLISSPPLVDVRYMIQVTDSFGCSGSSSFDYTSIHVKAEFTAEPTGGEAPLEVIFTDKSIRGFHYTWKFGDDSISVLPDPGPHKYYTPGKYTITLIIESELTCRDSATVNITVDPSLLQMPNVFTPNDDGINDFFVPDKKSLKFINLQIFSKSGRRVYNYEGRGENIQTWQGWDGKINNSERYAEPGAYFYVLRAAGYDDKEYEGRDYRGALYLYR